MSEGYGGTRVRRDSADLAMKKADAALALSLYAVMLASSRPRRKSIGDRLWDLI